MTTRFNPPDVWQPFGAFSMGAVSGSGNTVHLKGQVALDRDGNVVAPGDMRPQVQKVHENIKAVLDHVGGDMSDIFSLTQYTTDIEQFMQTGDIRTAFFAEPFPVTTTIEVSRLYNKDLVIEITAIAEIPTHRFRPPS
jgi:enamine deaminase RidA (YjgF/YER057c/UK114 family)